MTADLKRLLWPIEWDHLKEWHKNHARLCSQTDDFVGARVHRERYAEMLRIEEQSALTRTTPP